MMKAHRVLGTLWMALGGFLGIMVLWQPQRNNNSYTMFIIFNKLQTPAALNSLGNL